MPKALTDEERENLNDLYRKGFTVVNAAILANRSTSTVSKYFAILRGRSMTPEEQGERIGEANRR